MRLTQSHRTFTLCGLCLLLASGCGSVGEPEGLRVAESRRSVPLRPIASENDGRHHFASLAYSYPFFQTVLA